MKQLPDNYIGAQLSHATMRQEDLIPSFMEFIQNVKEKCEITEQVDSLQEEVDELEIIEYEGYSGPYYKNPDDANWILHEDIWEILMNIAPKFTNFGSHEGDGSAYGFWTSEESLSEHIRETIQDLDNDFSFDTNLDLTLVKQELETLVDLLVAHDY